MHILLIDEQETPLSYPLKRVLQDRHITVHLGSHPDDWIDSALQLVPDLIVVMHPANEPALQGLLQQLQQNTCTISKPVIVISKQPLSKKLLHAFQVEIRAVFIQPFLIDEFVAAVERFRDA
jgi:DNA-binding response OmpR family regulator